MNRLYIFDLEGTLGVFTTTMHKHDIFIARPDLKAIDLPKEYEALDNLVALERAYEEVKPEMQKRQPSAQRRSFYNFPEDQKTLLEQLKEIFIDRDNVEQFYQTLNSLTGARTAVASRRNLGNRSH